MTSCLRTKIDMHCLVNFELFHLSLITYSSHNDPFYNNNYYHIAIYLKRENMKK